jgi:hypothetical protein
MARRDVTAPTYCGQMPSIDAFAFASIQLCTHLWEELELLVVSCGVREPPSRIAGAAIAGEILRLELVVMIDACDGAHWRAGIHGSQLRSLKATLEEVLDALGTATGEHQVASFEQAQDCLLEAIFDYCSMSSAGRASWPLRGAAL